MPLSRQPAPSSRRPSPPVLPRYSPAPVNLHVLTLFTLAALLESGSNRTGTNNHTPARKTNHTVKTTQAATKRRRRVLGNLTTTSSTQPTRPPLATAGLGRDPDRSRAPLRPFASRTGSTYTNRHRPNPTVWITPTTTRPPLAGVVAMANRPAATSGDAEEVIRPATRQATPGVT